MGRGSPGVLALVVVACTTVGGDGNSSISGGVPTTTSEPDATGTTSTASGDGSTAQASSSSTSVATDAGSGTSSGLPTDTTGTGDPVCPAPGAPDCSPGPGSGEGCSDPGSCFLPIVKDAVNATLAEHPEWFDAVDTTLALDAEAYMNQVVANVNGAGLCAIRDPNAGDEIAVKHDNDAAESFDVLTADGHARYGDGIYTATCSPAWF